MKKEYLEMIQRKKEFSIKVGVLESQKNEEVKELFGFKVIIDDSLKHDGMYFTVVKA